MLCYALKEHLNVMLMIIRDDVHAVCAIDWTFLIIFDYSAKSRCPVYWTKLENLK